VSTDRVSFGIEGLDTMLNGGLIPRTVATILGSYGTGKTSFALNFIWKGLQNNENVIYISLEESSERIRTYMELRGWDVASYIGTHLTLVNLDPSNFHLAVNSVKNELPELIKSLGATRVVIDPISLFEDLFDEDVDRRREMMRIMEGLRALDCTVVITTESDRTNPFSSRHNLVEYLSDTVILLRYARGDGNSDAHLAVEIVKMRMSSHSREVKPFEMLSDSIIVYTEANVF